MSERSKLTDLERRAILDGDFPTLHGSGRFEVGETMELTSRVSVRIEKRNLRKGKVVWDYTVIDMRPMFMRRAPHGREPSKPTRRRTETDAEYVERVTEWRQKLSKPPTEDAIEAARMDGSYTRSHTQSVPDSDDVVPPEFQNRLVTEARVRFAERRKDNDSEADAVAHGRQVAKQVRDLALGLARKGEDPLPFLAGVQRVISEERDKLRDAA